jgi:ABC-type antimicrobial peptide transport system permease subunit
MSGPSERESAFMIVYFMFVGSFFLTILTAAALYAPEEVFKSTFHIAAFVTLVVISIVTGLAGVIAEYFSRRQINKKKKNRVMEGHEV